MSKRKQVDASHEPDKRSKPNTKQSYKDLVYEPETPEESLLERIAELMQHIKARHTINLELCEELDRLPECTRFTAHSRDYEFRWKKRTKSLLPPKYACEDQKEQTIEEHLSKTFALKPSKCVERLETLRICVDDMHEKLGRNLQSYACIMSDKLPHALPRTICNAPRHLHVTVKNSESHDTLNVAKAVIESDRGELTWSTAYIDLSYYHAKVSELFDEHLIPKGIGKTISGDFASSPSNGLFMHNMTLYYFELIKHGCIHYYALSGDNQGTIYCSSSLSTCIHTVSLNSDTAKGRFDGSVMDWSQIKD